MIPSQSCIELKVVSHSTLKIYLMLLNASSIWLCCFGLLKPLHCNKNSSPRTSENYWQFFLIIYILFFLLQTARDMSLLTYFKKSEKISVLDPCNSCESMKNDFPNSNTGTGKGLRKFKCCLVGNEKTNSLCRERQEKKCKINGSLRSYSGYQKITTKVLKHNQMYRASIGKKSQKIHTGAEEEWRNQCAINNWKS